MPNWKDAPTNEKLMAALVASIENKVSGLLQFRIVPVLAPSSKTKLFAIVRWHSIGYAPIPVTFCFCSFPLEFRQWPLMSEQINYNEVARYFGEGTTYSSIENRLRSTRKLSDELRVAVGEEPFGKGAKPKSSAGASE